MAKNEVKVYITGDAARLGGALDAASGKMAAFSAKMKAIGTKLRSVGQSMTLGLTVPIVAAGAVAVKWAGELEDAQAASEQVFGEMSKDMDRWADNAAKNFGLSKGDATEWAAQVGIRLKSIGGMTDEAAANWSQSLVQLGGDFASFFGGTTQEAVEAINSALTGEMEPLKRYGVVINDAALKAEIFRTSGEKVTGTLTAQQKQMATLSLIMSNTGDIQGDYARNADGATNAQRTMTASLKDAATTLGTVLLPYVTQLVEWVTTMTEKFQDLSPAWQRVIVIGAAVAAALGPLIYILGGIATAIGFIASPVGLVVAAIAALVGAFLYFYNTNEDFKRWIDDTARVIWDTLVTAFNWVKDEVIPRLVDAFKWFMENVAPVLQRWWDVTGKIVGQIWDKVSAFIDWWKENVWPVTEAALELVMAIHRRLWPVVQWAWGNMWSLISLVVSNIRNAISAFVSFAAPIWSFLWGAFSSMVSAAWGQIQSKIQMALGVIRAVISFASSVLNADWGAMWQKMVSVVTAKASEIIGWVRGIPGRITGALGSVGRILYDAGYRIMTGLLDGLKAAWNQVSSYVSSIAGRIASLKGPLEYDAQLLIPAGNKIMEGLGSGLRSGFSDVETLVADMAPSISANVVTSAAGAPAAARSSAFTGGGVTYQITVNAGMGTDGAEVGREIVDSIASYERRNGTGWRN